MHLTNSVKDYLDALSSDKPTPGGGGTSALAGALGIALISMVGRISSRKFEGEKKEKMDGVLVTLSTLQKKTSAVIDEDPKAYQKVMDGYKNLKGASDKAKAEANVEAALEHSFRVQTALAEHLAEAKGLVGIVGGMSKGSIKNDLIVASSLLDGAFNGACATAKINVVYMKEGETRTKLEKELAEAEQRYRFI
jgi:methenyltetrahydrofolate cyclohydrolase